MVFPHSRSFSARIKRSSQYGVPRRLLPTEEEKNNLVDRATIAGGTTAGLGLLASGVSNFSPRLKPLENVGKRLFTYGTPAAIGTSSLISLLQDRGYLR